MLTLRVDARDVAGKVIDSTMTAEILVKGKALNAPVKKSAKPYGDSPGFYIITLPSNDKFEDVDVLKLTMAPSNGVSFARRELASKDLKAELIEMPDRVAKKIGGCSGSPASPLEFFDGFVDYIEFVGVLLTGSVAHASSYEYECTYAIRPWHGFKVTFSAADGAN